MKIVILTHTLNNNYGGLLQAFALQTVLKRMGHDTVTARFSVCCFKLRIIRFISYFIRRYLLGNLSQNAERKISVHTSRFVDTYMDTIDYFGGKTRPVPGVLKLYDAIVVGSDQVWRPAYMHVPAYFLDFTKDEKMKRIAYAASFGQDNWGEFSPALTRKCALYAKRFDAISVREDSAVKLCKEKLGVDALHLLDPTLLLDKEEYIRLADQEYPIVREKILMSYILDRSEDKRKITELLSHSLQLVPLEVMPAESLNTKCDNILAATYLPVEEWLAGFRDAEFILTDSFHGCVFSILFNKPFLVIGNKERGMSRFHSLLHMFELEDRLIDSSETVFSIDFLINKIDWNNVNRIRTEKKEYSISFLLKYLVHV